MDLAQLKFIRMRGEKNGRLENLVYEIGRCGNVSVRIRYYRLKKDKHIG